MALVTLTLASGSGVPGGTVNLDLSIASTGGALPTQIEWTFSNTSDVTLTNVVAGASATAAVKTVSRAGSLVIIAGPNINVIGDGVLATATFAIALSPSTTPVPISLTGIVISDADANPIPSASVPSSLTVNVPMLACPVSGDSAVVGLAYLNNMVASGGTPPYTYAVTGGALPNGLSMSSAGVISGTPTLLGIYSWTTTATDSVGAIAREDCGITVAAPAPPPSSCVVVPVPSYTSPLMLWNEPVEQVGT